MASSTGSTSRKATSKGATGTDSADERPVSEGVEVTTSDPAPALIEQDNAIGSGAPLDGSQVVTDVPAPPVETERPAGRQGGAPTAYLNMTNGPIVYDVEGHTVDGAGSGNAWTPEINLDVVGQQQRDLGYLLPKSAL